MQPTAPQDERFWLLVSLKLSGEATPDETRELAGLLRDHPEWGLRMEQMTNLWRQKPAKAAKGPSGSTAAGPNDPSWPNAAGPAASFDRHLQRLSTHLSNPILQYEDAPAKRKTRHLGRWLTAAALLGAILLIAIHTQKATAPTGLNTVTTRAGSRSKLQLPDGTLLWLNADSKLTYNINDQDREVQLTGEAWFDVAKDKNRPFILHTQTIDIRVLGTMFNVQCYGNERNTETSLFQGSIEVTLKNLPDKKIILRPSEKLTVHNNEMAVADIKTKTTQTDDEPLMTLGKVHYQQKDSSYIESLWTKNQLAFDDRSLEEVAKQIERWYGVHITITDEKLKTTRFSGVFEDETLPQVMEALKLIGDFQYKINKKEVTITP